MLLTKVLHETAPLRPMTAATRATACRVLLPQCVAAAHVAKNLNITGGFDALKLRVTGTGAMSLGKAIQSFDPNANAKSEVKKANKQADDDMKEAETNS